MTSGVLLGTAKEHKIVCAAAVECDFRQGKRDEVYLHKTVADLRLQIHTHASHFFDIEGIVTQVEFDDLTDRFPDHPRAIEVLRELSIVVPDFWYRKNVLFLDDLRPALPLSEYLLKLEK